ncbi:MAG: hypothetical protein HZY75_13120 [Nocardioidaceae bacterium]|nr:MAG: hypothetical protein HZY75_13120 [Nocardioidaceae bacterium]
MPARLEHADRYWTIVGATDRAQVQARIDQLMADGGGLMRLELEGLGPIMIAVTPDGPTPGIESVRLVD